jgi:hypothetical protein
MSNVVRGSIALAIALATLPACAGDEVVDCYPAGTYVDVNADLGTSTARICFDDRCETLTSKNTPDDPFLSFDTPYWEEGNSFELSIEVFDANGSLIGSMAEQRTMDSNGEACGVLQYGWTEGRLTRIN